MIIIKLRAYVQALSFLILTYGTKLGLNFRGGAIPCLSCQLVTTGCGGCFLRVIQAFLSFLPGLQDLWGPDTRGFISSALMFLALFILLGRVFCGFVCPLGFLQDIITLARQNLGITEASLGEGAKRNLRRVGLFILFIAIIIAPLSYNFGLLHPDFIYAFCRICPEGIILPLFSGESRYLSLDLTNKATLVLSVLGIFGTGILTGAVFWKKRFFCFVCPLGALMGLMSPLGLIRLKKDQKSCVECGSCVEVCPMDIKEIAVKRQDKINESSCVKCGECLKVAKPKGCLSCAYLGRRIV